ncbi:hypothetical protein [Tunicatimonas pelagia]|uniref:hypothetical protein n=1 Tax=Tunicatimonas pelagia TaxID=931531 RepID=UPI002666CFF2|nr:hypothetical protein [Tunicatimonas pelagia]WKN42995.1 hypothetical protein P0M28_28555 [Tunicatimonas pelagia]
MELTILVLSCLLFYAPSRYFPVDSILRVNIAQYRKVMLIGATLLLLVSFASFYQTYDGFTAFAIWLTAGTTILSALILTVKLDLRWLYGWGMLCVLFLITDPML